MHGIISVKCLYKSNFPDWQASYLPCHPLEGCGPGWEEGEEGADEGEELYRYSTIVY